MRKNGYIHLTHLEIKTSDSVLPCFNGAHICGALALANDTCGIVRVMEHLGSDDFNVDITDGQSVLTWGKCQI
jgi:hypothetical protein